MRAPTETRSTPGGGIFDVKLDGKLIYTKHETGRFSEHHEVLNRLPAKA